jgi:hypothetical protein
VPPELRAALASLAEAAAAHGTTSHAARLRWLAYHSWLNGGASGPRGDDDGQDAVVLSPRSWAELEASVAAVARGPLDVGDAGDAEVLRAVEALAAAAEGVFLAGMKGPAGRMDETGGRHGEGKRG